MKKKFLSYGVAAVALATGSMFLATPAFADIPLATASNMSVAQGGTFTATVTNQTPGVVSSNDFCNGETGPGMTMGVILIGPTIWNYPSTPTGVGFGSFSWDGSDAATASVEVTIPADLTPGNYNLILVCRKAGIPPALGQGVDGQFTVTAAAPAPAPDALPDTGAKDSAQFLFGGVAAGVLVALGVTAILVRRRLS